MKNNIKITPEVARSIVYEDTSDFIMIERDVTDTSRWSIMYEGICQNIETKKYYFMDWSEGSTEMQDESPYEYSSDPVILIEAVKEKVLVEKWVVLK